MKILNNPLLFRALIAVFRRNWKRREFYQGQPGEGGCVGEL
jgi:hypothetical protein